MKAYKKIMDVLAMIEKVILVLTSTIILVLVFGNVLTRKIPFIKTSWSFTEELVIALFVLISLLASALCCRENSNISLTLLTTRITGGKLKLVKIITTVISVLYCAVLTCQGWKYMMNELNVGTHTFVLHWPYWIFCAFVPISGFFMILHLIEYCIDFLSNSSENNGEVVSETEEIETRGQEA